jgi:glutamate-1-semialdehyde 2,1-aminomutase
MIDKSVELFKEAEQLIPGGVNSPVRAFKSVDSSPIYMKKGIGSKMVDVDDNEYIDFCSSWGPLILGHARREVIDAITDEAQNGVSFGTCTPNEVKMAKLIKELIPYAEMNRCVNSGTEATMTALRLARGYTQRKLIVKFDGCYHGHADYLLVSSGSGLLTNQVTTSAGVSDKVVSEVIVLPYNDLDALRKAFEEYGDDIAAVIVEPIAGNMGLIKPTKEFLTKLRKVTSASGSILIFDEVITGFRLGATSYGNIIGIEPDLTCLGKIIGGGMPIGAIAGKKEIMEHLAPLGNVYQAGTLSGNPVALAAGVTTLELLRDENPYPKLEEYAKKIEAAANETGKCFCSRVGGMFTIFWGITEEPQNLDDVKKANTATFTDYFKFMLNNGIYLSPSQFELGFISAVHTDADIDKFIEKLLEFTDGL